MKEMAPDPEELHEMKLNEETYPLTEELFENDALIFDNTQIEDCLLYTSYYKPRVDKELLRKYHKGIIALSACLAGEVRCV